MAALAERLDRRLMLRLVKGAYWDTEVKRAQERGLDDYPVFTRKAMTDLNYMACARKLLALRPRIFPQFATHNALTIATITELSAAPAASSSSACTAWAMRPMGSGSPPIRMWAAAPMPPWAGIATCSPIWCAACWRMAPFLLRLGGRRSGRAGERSLRRPAALIGNAEEARNRHIPLPPDLYGPGRRNSHGVELGCRSVLAATLTDIAGHRREVTASTLIDGVAHAGATRTVVSPSTEAPSAAWWRRMRPRRMRQSPPR